MIIIGITGTLGSGKGTSAEYFVSKYGFVHYSAKNLIAEETEKRNLPINRDTLVQVANDLRAKYGASYVMEKLYKQSAETSKNSVFESIRTPAEIETLKSKGRFYLLTISADLRIRYERIRLRNSQTDKITFEKFRNDEKREMSSDNQNYQNLEACIEKADFNLVNNGTKEELCGKIDAIMKKIIKN